MGYGLLQSDLEILDCSPLDHSYIQTGHIGDEETQMRMRKELEEEEVEEWVAFPHQAAQ